VSKYGWGGAQPEQFRDIGDDYELGTHFKALADVTVTHIRIWRGANDLAITGRRAYIWSAAGTPLQTVVIDDSLPLNQWSRWPLSPYLTMSTNTEWWATFGAAEYYGAVPAALVTPVTSLDGRVSVIESKLNADVGDFPNLLFGNPFYAVDVEYAETITGALDTTLPVPTATAAGTLTVEGDLAGVLPAFVGSLAGTVTSSGPGGVHVPVPGWYGLLEIAREAATWADEDRNRPPVACPNCGEPLRSGPHGTLYCSFDGYRWE
jgi:Domain of unknown function (DUF4082)